MDGKLVRAILNRAATERVLFRYFKDRYALLLLALAAGDGRRLSDLRKGPLGRLFRKQVVNQILGQEPVLERQPELLRSYWVEDALCYRLSLGCWGSAKGGLWYDQTSRRGYNIVLLLNYSSEHDERYRRLVRPSDDHPFLFDCHPHDRHGRHTMVWARIDADFHHGEALIEEIQNDWIREADSRLNRVRPFATNPKRWERMCRVWLDGARCTPSSLEGYVRGVLAPHRRLWAEAMLAAAIWFIREDLGIREIYYHTHETGCRLKRIYYGKPPVSLYEQLPRKFCFERIDRLPQFLGRRRGTRMQRRQQQPSFWHLRL